MIQPQICNKRLAGGTICVFLLVTMWQAMGVLMGKLSSGQFFNSWVVHVFYILCIPLYYLVKYCYPDSSIARNHTSTFNTKQLFYVCLIVSIVQLFGMALWYLSLDMTLLSLNNALFQTCAVFVYLAEICFLSKKIEKSSAIAILLVMLGVSFILWTQLSNSDRCAILRVDCGKSDKTGDNDHGHVIKFIGYVWLFLGILLYVIYQIIFKLWSEMTSIANVELSGDDQASRDRAESLLQTESSNVRSHCNETDFIEDSEFDVDENKEKSCYMSTTLDTLIFVGWIGICNTFFLWPLLVLFHYTGAETFHMPIGKHLQSLLITAFLDTFYQIVLLLGVALTCTLYSL